MSNKHRIASNVFIVLCGTVFVLRGPVRALRDPGLNDLWSPYVQAIAWIHGLDPYSPRSLSVMWPHNGVQKPDREQFEDGSILVRHGIPTAYPITSFALLAPLTFLQWPAAKMLWIVLSCGLFFAMLRVLVTVGGLDSVKTTLFIALSLLLAPFHTGLAVCNPAIVATELGIISLWALRTNRAILGGLLASVSLGLKPQIGICFLVSFVIVRNWKISIVSATGLLTLAAGSALRLWCAHACWLGTYKMDSDALLVNGVLGDFTDRNPTRFGLVNLQVALYPIFGDREATNLVAIGICTLLAASAAAMILRMRSRDELLCLSTISVLSLLPFYHRFYDAALLIVPIVWLISKLGRRPGLPIVVGLAVIGAFLIPGGTLLEIFRDRDVFPAALASNPWWNTLVMAHEPWLLLGLALILMRCLARNSEVVTHDEGRHIPCEAA